MEDPGWRGRRGPGLVVITLPACTDVENAGTTTVANPACWSISSALVPGSETTLGTGTGGRPLESCTASAAPNGAVVGPAALPSYTAIVSPLATDWEYTASDAGAVAVNPASTSFAIASLRGNPTTSGSWTGGGPAEARTCSLAPSRRRCPGRGCWAVMSPNGTVLDITSRSTTTVTSWLARSALAVATGSLGTLGTLKVATGVLRVSTMPAAAAPTASTTSMTSTTGQRRRDRVEARGSLRTTAGPGVRIVASVTGARCTSVRSRAGGGACTVVSSRATCTARCCPVSSSVVGGWEPIVGARLGVRRGAGGGSDWASSVSLASSDAASRRVRGSGDAAARSTPSRGPSEGLHGSGAPTP